MVESVGGICGSISLFAFLNVLKIDIFVTHIKTVDFSYKLMLNSGVRGTMVPTHS
jgi:hypothetical protein